MISKRKDDSKRSEHLKNGKIPTCDVRALIELSSTRAAKLVFENLNRIVRKNFSTLLVLKNFSRQPWLSLIFVEQP